MSLSRHVIPTLLTLVACSSTASSPSSSPIPAPEETCAGDRKVCSGSCVSKTSPVVGCAAPSCSPCDLPRAAATCDPSGACAVGTCENGWGDCDGRAENGCETDLSRDAANCGVCGVSCGPSSVCRSAFCVDANVAAAAEWLGPKTTGWCLESYNQLINLCGDVEYCFDKRFMRPYPTGLAVDVAFVTEAAKGYVVSLGGDCGGKSVTISLSATGSVTASGFGAGAIEVALSPGKHLVSYQVSSTGSALFVDGARVGIGAAPAAPIELADACGPGLVIGQRISYWWEPPQQQTWSRIAPFFLQLREGISDASAYSVARATTAAQGTVLLFDEAGVDGTRWKASVGDLTGVTKNALDGTAQIDAGASGPLPVWKPLSACALK